MRVGVWVHGCVIAATGWCEGASWWACVDVGVWACWPGRGRLRRGRWVAGGVHGRSSGRGRGWVQVWASDWERWWDDVGCGVVMEWGWDPCLCTGQTTFAPLSRVECSSCQLSLLHLPCRQTPQSFKMTTRLTLLLSSLEGSHSRLCAADPKVLTPFRQGSILAAAGCVICVICV